MATTSWTAASKNPRAKPFCKYGHDMSVTRVWRDSGSTYCSTCHKERYSRSSKEEVASKKLKKAYGITLVEKESLLILQGGVCAICGTNDWGKLGPCVDHDHETGVVRGILCRVCNTGLGCFGDSRELMLEAAAYLGNNGHN